MILISFRIQKIPDFIFFRIPSTNLAEKTKLSPWKKNNHSKIDVRKTPMIFTILKKKRMESCVFCWKKSKEMGCVGRVQPSQKFARFFVGICKLGIFVCCLKERQGQLSSIPFATRGQFVRKRSVKNTYRKHREKSEKFEIVWYRNLATVMQCYALWNLRKDEINDETINRFWGKKTLHSGAILFAKTPEDSEEFHPRISTLLWPLIGIPIGAIVVCVQHYPLKHCRHNNHNWVARGHWRRWIFVQDSCTKLRRKRIQFHQKASSQLLCWICTFYGSQFSRQVRRKQLCPSRECRHSNCPGTPRKALVGLGSPGNKFASEFVFQTACIKRWCSSSFASLQLLFRLHVFGNLERCVWSWSFPSQ